MLKKTTILFIFLISAMFLTAQNVPSNWNVLGTAMTISESTQASQGTKAVSITWTSQNNQDFQSDPIPVAANDAFTASFDILDNDAAGRVRMLIYWTGATGSYSQDVYSVDKATYQTLTISGTVPVGATEAKICIRAYDVAATWTGSATVIVDNVIFTLNGGSNLAPNQSFETWGQAVPNILILYPSNNANITGQNLNVAFSTPNFSLGTDGKVKYILDGGAAQYVTASPIALTNLSVGAHTLSLELVNISEQSLDPQVIKTVSFTISEGGGSSTTPIRDIQYTTAADGASPLNNQIVTTSGIVTAIKGTKFWIQDGVGAWCGLYVYNVNAALTMPAVGDSVVVIGKVAEYNNLTELKEITSITIVSSGKPLPAATTVTALEANTEAYESVLIKVTGTCSSIGTSTPITWQLTDLTGAVSISNFLYTHTVTLNENYSVTGILDFYSTFKIYPRKAEDIVSQGANTNPIIIVSSPTDNSTIYSSDVSVVFSVNNFNLGTQGKLAYKVDNGETSYVTSSPIAISGLSDGTHTISLELVDMSNNSLSPVVKTVLNIIINSAGPTYTNIYDIQYTTAADGASPYANQIVWVRGVVSANFNGFQYGKGYYVQQGEGAWKSLYIFDQTHTPTIGDSISIQGTIVEFNGMTEMKNVSSYTVVGVDGIVAPATSVTIPEALTEQYESCLVKISNVTCTVANQAYGEFTVSDGTNTMKIKDNGGMSFNEVVGTSYNITGVIDYYNYNRINYRRDSDISIANNIDIVQKNVVNIYPNPTSDILYIDNVNENIELSISNMIGQTIIKKNLAYVGKQTIDLSNLTNGTYIITIKDNNQVQNIKLIKN